jgi:branched-chain amino acid transport system ATP-binding protein
MALLSVDSLSKQFGGLSAIDGLNFSVEEGEIRGLIGPNGAGKTTTFNVICGFYAPTTGSIVYQDRDISGMRPSAIAELGLIRTFQATTLFHEFTVLDNVLVGCHLRARQGFLATLLGAGRSREAAAVDKAMQVLDFFGLSERRDELAMSLPHGLQRTLGMAVALAAEPRLLLLDEPFTGMNPEETRQMMELVRRVRDQGVTILLVEHDMQAVMGLCEKITVLNFGKMLTEGTPEEIRRHSGVIEAYLGAAGNAA